MPYRMWGFTLRTATAWMSMKNEYSAYMKFLQRADHPPHLMHWTEGVYRTRDIPIGPVLDLRLHNRGLTALCPSGTWDISHGNSPPSCRPWAPPKGLTTGRFYVTRNDTVVTLASPRAQHDTSLLVHGQVPVAVLPPSTYSSTFLRDDDTVVTLATDQCARITHLPSATTWAVDLDVTCLCADAIGTTIFLGGIDGCVYIANDPNESATPVSAQGAAITAIATVKRPLMIHRYIVVGRIDGTVEVLCNPLGSNATSVIAHVNRHDGPVSHVCADATRIVSIDTHGTIIASGLVIDSDPWFAFPAGAGVSCLDMSARSLAIGHTTGVTLLTFDGDGHIPAHPTKRGGGGGGNGGKAFLLHQVA
jgi:hypothetical protein